MRVLELHISEYTGPHIVTVTVDLQVAFERVASTDFGGQGHTHAAVILLLHLHKERGGVSLYLTPTAGTLTLRASSGVMCWALIKSSSAACRLSPRLMLR